MIPLPLIVTHRLLCFEFSISSRCFFAFFLFSFFRLKNDYRTNHRSVISLHLSFIAISGFGASRQFPRFLSSRYIHIPPFDIHTYLPASWPLINVCVFGFDTTPLFRLLFYLHLPPKVLYIGYPILHFFSLLLSYRLHPFYTY